MSIIYLYSIDYDGCIAGLGPKTLKTTALFEHIKRSLMGESDATVILMVGSYRQTIFSDAHCWRVNQNGSCFKAFENLILEFKSLYPDLAQRITLDQFLLADIIENTATGSHFRMAICLHENDPVRYQNAFTQPEPAWHDTTKCGLQYAQMHYVASRFPKEKIYYFFHDNCNELILLPSHHFFMRFPLSVPHNVVHKLFCYAMGSYLKDFVPIQGLGEIDFDYQKNILQFNGKLNNPINQKQLQIEIESGTDYELQCSIKKKGRFFPFWQLLRIRGVEYSNKLIRQLHDQDIQREYEGHLLHIAIQQSDLESMKRLLLNGANYRTLNVEKLSVLECVINSHNAAMISYFIEYTQIQNDPLIDPFVSALSMIQFHRWMNELLVLRFQQAAHCLLLSRFKEPVLVKTYFTIGIESKRPHFSLNKPLYTHIIKTLFSIANSYISPLMYQFREFLNRYFLFTSDFFEEKGVAALCFLLNKMQKQKQEMLEEWLFSILIMLPEIKNQMSRPNSVHETIERHYQHFLAYQSIMLGKTKEELCDLISVGNIIKANVDLNLNDIIQYLKMKHVDVPWSQGHVETTKVIILNSIRLQCEKNKHNGKIIHAFLLLQCAISTFPLSDVMVLIEKWKNMKVYPDTEETILDIVKNEDDTQSCSCFSFFSVNNMRFIEKLPDRINKMRRVNK